MNDGFAQNDLESFRSLRIWSTLGHVAGLAGVAVPWLAPPKALVEGGPWPLSMSPRFTHSRSAPSVRSRSLATRPTLRSPTLHSRTASALNSAVNDLRFRPMVEYSYRTPARFLVSIEADRSGGGSDVEWSQGFVRFRRSHTRGEETMVGTKTGTRERV